MFGVLIGCGSSAATQLLVAHADEAAKPEAATAASGRMPRVAVVDLQRALIESDEGLRAQARLRSSFDDKQRSLDAEQRSIQDEQRAIEEARKRGVVPSTLQPRIEALQQRAVALQNMYLHHQQALKSEEATAMAPLVQRMQDALRQMGEYDVILDRAAVPYFDPSYDITERAVAALNAQK